MKKCVLRISVVLLALVATVVWLGCGRRNVTKQTASRISSQPGNKLSFPMPPVSTNPDIPDADRKDDVLWRKTPEAQASWNEIMGTITAVEAGGKPLTINQAEALIAYMQSPHYFARWKAVIAAGTARSGPAKSMLLPYVINLLTDPVPIVRLYAADALSFIGDKSTIPALKTLLDDQDPGVARVALESIKRLEQRGGLARRD